MVRIPTHQAIPGKGGRRDGFGLTTRRMFAWLREIGLRLLSTLGLYNKKATLVLLGKPKNQ